MPRSFTEDAVLDTSPAGGLRIEGRDAAVAYVRSSISEDTITTHHVHAPEIEIDGDTCHGDLGDAGPQSCGRADANCWALAIITNAIGEWRGRGGSRKAADADQHRDGGIAAMRTMC